MGSINGGIYIPNWVLSMLKPLLTELGCQTKCVNDISVLISINIDFTDFLCVIETVDAIFCTTPVSSSYLAILLQ